MGNWDHLDGMVFDFETLAETPDACIMSIAAVMFRIHDGYIGNEFRVNLNVKQAKGYGLRTQKKTMEWWKEQDPEILKSCLKNPVDYRDGLLQFFEYAKRMKPNHVWAWGINFDIPIFEMNLMLTNPEKEPVKLPWEYWNASDARTLKNVFKVPIDRGNTKHDPMEDVKAQAKYLINFFKDLEGNTDDTDD